jgi:hypothetical protein
MIAVGLAVWLGAVAWPRMQVAILVLSGALVAFAVFGLLRGVAESQVTLGGMRLYHRTDARDAILADGFTDAEGDYLTDRIHGGVWLRDRILDANEGTAGEDVLDLEIPEEIVAPFEWVEEDTGYREFLVPAEIANRYLRQP